MILQMPYWDASGLILFIYSRGSCHSSAVGRYVGASEMPCGLLAFLTGSRVAVGWPRRSTDVKSRAALDMALSGIVPFGWYPLELTFLVGPTELRALVVAAAALAVIPGDMVGDQ